MFRQEIGNGKTQSHLRMQHIQNDIVCLNSDFIKYKHKMSSPAKRLSKSPVRSVHK